MVTSYGQKPSWGGSLPSTVWTRQLIFVPFCYRFTGVKTAKNRKGGLLGVFSAIWRVCLEILPLHKSKEKSRKTSEQSRPTLEKLRKQLRANICFHFFISFCLFWPPLLRTACLRKHVNCFMAIVAVNPQSSKHPRSSFDSCGASTGKNCEKDILKYN